MILGTAISYIKVLFIMNLRGAFQSNSEKFCFGKFLIKHRKDIWESAIISLRQVPSGMNYTLQLYKLFIL